jgi:pyrimidine operon attenuation protein/uracil phosphoribosyltransferase
MPHLAQADAEEDAPIVSGRQLLSPRDFPAVYASWLAAVREGMELARDWALVGIKRRGAVLARRLRDDLASPAYGEVDISLYRDDYHLQAASPQVLGTEIGFSVEKRSILLVDDVLFTGRTVRAALNVLLDFGRPRLILLAVFVDRGHRELPIAADFVGLRCATEREDRVLVRLREMGDPADSVDVFAAGAGGPSVGVDPSAPRSRV